jgi:putative endonuclease
MFSTILRIVDRVRHHRRSKLWDADRALGRRGEDIAHRYLQRQGMTVVARNYRTATGSAEADLAAWDRDTLVFVEVKTRRTADFGPPDRAVGDDKRRAILRAAADYARRAGLPAEQIRFDVVSVVCSSPPVVEHIRDAFSARALARSA